MEDSVANHFMGQRIKFDMLYAIYILKNQDILYWPTVFFFQDLPDL